jgi:hypothetical protein
MTVPAAYAPTFRKQLTGTACGSDNCQMAAIAHLADKMTLGQIRKTADQMRTLSGTAGRCVDGIRGNDGTNRADAMRVLSGLHLYPTAFDRTDHWTAAAMRSNAYRGIVVGGAYDKVPLGLKGDREYNGIHGVYVNDFNPSVVIAPRQEFGGFTGPAYHVWDSLNDGRHDSPSGKLAPTGPIWWPAPVLEAFAEAEDRNATTPKTGNYSVIIAPRTSATVRPDVPTANIRAAATRASAVIESALAGAVLVASVLPDHGELIGIDDRWWRVWAPVAGRVGFMHSSVVTIVSIA